MEAVGVEANPEGMLVGIKRSLITNTEVNTISDEDFVDDTYPKRLKLKAKRVGRPSKENASKKAAHMLELYASYPMLSLRCSPCGIFKLIKELDERQREDVKALGFGSILDLTINELPNRLAHWVVENFNVQSCELKLRDGRRVEINERDVHLVLGFPIGGRRILPVEQEEYEEGETEKTLAMYDEWKSMFNEIAGNGKILQKHVVQLIENEKEGGVWFKRHFVVLLASCLMESTTHGYISPTFMHCLKDVTSVKHWNWSEFVVGCLVRSKIAWNEDKSQKFISPALFLMVLYIDRVKVLNVVVPREFPSFVNWDYTRLKERQDDEMRTGGFGGGLVLNRITNDVDDVAKKCIGSDYTSGINVDDVDAIRYCKNIITKSNVIGKQMVDLLNMIDNAPPSIVDTIYFKKAVETTCSLIGNKIFSEDTHVNTQPPISSTQRFEDGIWESEDVLKSLYDVEAAQIKIIDFLKRTNDYPSFSIGLTQVFNSSTDGQYNGDASAVTEEGHLRTKTCENGHRGVLSNGTLGGGPVGKIVGQITREQEDQVLEETCHADKTNGVPGAEPILENIEMHVL